MNGMAKCILTWPEHFCLAHCLFQSQQKTFLKLTNFFYRNNFHNTVFKIFSFFYLRTALFIQFVFYFKLEYKDFHHFIFIQALIEK